MKFESYKCDICEAGDKVFKYNLTEDFAVLRLCKKHYDMVGAHLEKKTQEPPDPSGKRHKAGE